MRKLKAKNLNRSTAGSVPIMILIFGVGIFTVLPLIYTVVTAFKPLDEMFIFPPRFFVRNPTLTNFSDLLVFLQSGKITFERYVFNTIVVAFVGTFGHVVLASLCAYAISKLYVPFKKVIFQTIVLSLMFTSTASGIAVYIIMQKLNLLNTYGAYIFPSIAMPLGFYLMKQFIDQMISDTLIEAGRIDGASELTIFYRIVLPNVKPAVLTLIVQVFQVFWGTGATNYVYVEELKTMNYAIGQILAGGVSRTGASAAASLVMIIPPILVFVFSQSNVVETMASSGIKE